jgi:hypothetical protein
VPGEARLMSRRENAFATLTVLSAPAAEAEAVTA